MHPFRTAVKISLIPLRTLVNIGDRFVELGEQAEQPPPRPRKATRTQATRTQATRTQARRRQAARKRTAPQASRRPKDLDDVGLARKVETVIFRDDDVPKGKIDVNAADGVVWLRGEAKTPEMIKELEREAVAIREVKRVENLLHLPKTPAPTRTDTPAPQRRTQSTPQRPVERNVETAVTGEPRGSGS